ncbi:MAG: ABC transporter permease subunit [Coriobacteriales bacterium]|jgi:putative spermidine/putrescine transport system permease protein|nr:ABC transporter permease subunit [Coriobacteriales bacterium]
MVADKTLDNTTTNETDKTVESPRTRNHKGLGGQAPFLRTRKKTNGTGGALTPYLMAFPYLLLILILPISCYNIVIQSFGVVPGIEDKLTIDAFVTIFSSSRTMNGIALSLFIAVAATFPSAAIGILLTWCIVTLQKETILGMIIAKIPQLIPHSVACVIIVNLFLPSGVIARLLMALGFTDASGWFMETLYYPNSIGIIIELIWKESAFFCMMLLPGMSGISNSLGEASRSLGASHFKAFLTVTVPNCMPIVRTCIIIVFVLTFGSYETPYLLGSPITKALPVLAYAEYGVAGLAEHRPISMALNLIMVLIALAFSLAYYLYSVKKEKQLRGAE